MDGSEGAGRPGPHLVLGGGTSCDDMRRQCGPTEISPWAANHLATPLLRSFGVSLIQALLSPYIGEYHSRQFGILTKASYGHDPNFYFAKDVFQLIFLTFCNLHYKNEA